ncbi:flagellar protein FlaF [Desulfosarcina ovata subsp. sediminis]|uniref:Flagellar protein FlaF n=1 Tax=Desulfosarcina ovata subsp. sediminis TaxID=885957 RepID=A0A5K7ZFP9_9BACT|nr:flagellar biosynthesis regulator FlaF [Desulfosarcina ovata]BBO79786.1 flagellar protein FlaF [Desulfosarcina ovata subsp. sediminis]
MFKNPLSAYQAVEQTTTSGRATEARVLTKAAMMLKECQNNWDLPNSKPKLHEALEYNQRIWSIIQGSLMDENNPLPKKIRIDILTLSAYIDKRIFNVLAYPAPEKLSIIIDINLNLAAGLRS